ncbi:MAG: hypothetical protein MUF87_01680 [Anaerolineae bacterium]|jgi:hypothetical protein|nr:hypothetical protein [Anaerolineae bacterium]
MAIEPNPIERLIQILALFLIAAAFAFFGVSSDGRGGRTPEMTLPPNAFLIQVNEARVDLTAGTVQVIGYIQDGCSDPVQMLQRLEGQTIYVDLFRVIPSGQNCPRNIVDYNETHTLNYAIDSTYTVIVNGVTAQ